MGLIDEEKFWEGLYGLWDTTDETGTYTFEEFLRRGKEPKIRRDVLLEHVKDCQADILSPPEIEAGIKWFERRPNWKIQPIATYYEIANLFRAVLKQQQNSWNVKEIFKVEEKKGEREN